MYEGKLFCLTGDRAHGPGRSHHRSEVEYVWMCDVCLRDFEPTQEPDGEIGLKPLTEIIDQSAGR